MKAGVEVITPNPKTSGGARWNFLAAWDWANSKFGGDEAEERRTSSRELYKHVPVLDSGARGSTTTFVQRGIGDVLLAWENEAFLAGQGARRRPVRHRRAAAVDPGRAAGGAGRQERRRQGHARSRGGLPRVPLQRRGPEDHRAATSTARANPAVADPADLKRFPRSKLVTIDDPLFGGWAKAHAEASSPTAASSTRSTSRQ